MMRELKVTLTKAEVGELLVKAVTRRLNLPDGDHECTACNMNGDGLVLSYTIREKTES